MRFSSQELDQLYVDWKMSNKLVLPAACTIVVAGAFEGRLMRLLAEMYPKHRMIIGFEPQKEAAARCYENTKKYPHMVVCASGLLADKRIHETLPMGEYGNDACSMLGAPREQGEGIFSDAYVQLAHSTPIDLFVLNVEGFEYTLLEYLADKGPEYIRQFSVQFHTKYAKSEYHTQELMRYMEDKYGEPIYNDYPRWVYWGKQQ